MHLSSGMAAGAALAVIAAPTAAIADRPGTPNNERASVCANYLTEKPRVCVEFFNTATEEVTFDIEFTVDGVKVEGPRPKAETLNWKNLPKGRRLCIGCTINFVRGHTDAQDFFMYGSDPRSARPVKGVTNTDDENGSGIPLMGFGISDLDYGVTYCFRFKARRASDGMVSENWSNWACVKTWEAPPLPPTKPQHVTAEYFQGGRDWRVKPPKVVMTWERGERAGSYTVGKTEYRNDEFKADIVLSEGSWMENEANPSIVIPVCAKNISGEACASATTYRPPGDSVPRPPHYEDDVTLPHQPQQDTNRPIPIQPPTSGADHVDRPSGGFGTGMAVPAGSASKGSTACASGFVWRVARGEDLVCVTPAARRRIKQENAESPSHVDPGGAYGPNTCVAGFVWREAFAGDVACVTQASRAQARQENADGPSHLADSGDVFRAPH